MPEPEVSDLSVAGGLEPLFGKVAGQGAVKAFGWGSRALRAKYADRRMVKLLPQPATAARATDLAREISATASADIKTFLESPEIDHIAFALATQRMLLACSAKKAEARSAEIEREFKEAFRLAVLDVSKEQREGLGRLIFDLIDAMVVSNVASLAGANGDRLPSSTRAALVKSAVAIAAAAVRNAELLSELGSLDSFREFEKQFRAQVLNMHGTNAPPTCWYH